MSALPKEIEALAREVGKCSGCDGGGHWHLPCPCDACGWGEAPCSGPGPSATECECCDGAGVHAKTGALIAAIAAEVATAERRGAEAGLEAAALIVEDDRPWQGGLRLARTAHTQIARTIRRLDPELVIEAAARTGGDAADERSGP